MTDLFGRSVRDFPFLVGVSCGHSVVLRTTLQLPADDDGPILEVHAVPGQTQRFALTQSGKEDHAENGAVVLIVMTIPFRCAPRHKKA